MSIPCIFVVVVVKNHCLKKKRVSRLLAQHINCEEDLEYESSRTFNLSSKSHLVARQPKLNIRCFLFAN